MLGVTMLGVTMTPMDCWAVLFTVFVALIIAFGMGFWLGRLWEDSGKILKDKDD